MASKPLVLRRKPPTRIVRKPIRGQTQLELRPRVRLATRRRRARAVGVAAALCAVAVMVWGASLVSYHERFAINDITVVGTQALSAAAVEATFGNNVNDGIHHFFSRANVFLFPRDELRDAMLRELPLLNTVSFTRDSFLSQTLTISVTERIPQYVWCNNECYFIDADGFVFTKAANPGGFLVFRGGLLTDTDPVGQYFMRGKLGLLAETVKGVKDAGFSPTGATVENDTDISIRLDEGFVVKARLDAEARELGKNLALAVSSEALLGKLEEIEYIDLRFGNRVYYNLKQ